MALANYTVLPENGH